MRALDEETRKRMQRAWLLLYTQRTMPTIDKSFSGCRAVWIDRDDEDDCWYVTLECPFRQNAIILVTEDGSLLWFDDIVVAGPLLDRLCYPRNGSTLN
jgi:hypothetical protein